MLLCFNDEKHPAVNLELKKLKYIKKMQIAYGNEKLDIILRQVDASQHSRQTLGSNYCGF